MIRTRGTGSSVAHAWYNTLLLMMPTVQMDLNGKNTLSPPTKKLVHYHHFTPLAVLTKLFYTWRPYKILKCRSVALVEGMCVRARAGLGLALALAPSHHSLIKASEVEAAPHLIHY